MCSVVLFWGIFNYLNWPSFHWAGVYRLNPIVYQRCTVMQSNDVKCVSGAAPLGRSLSLNPSAFIFPSERIVPVWTVPVWLMVNY